MGFVAKVQCYYWIVSKKYEIGSYTSYLYINYVDFFSILGRRLQRFQTSRPPTQVQTRRKAAKMLMTIVILFAVCYLPVHVLNILKWVFLSPLIFSHMHVD